MRIGELAKRAGVATSAIRYYERIGLMPRAARISKSRVYDGDALPRLALIGFAQACGFRIAEVRALLAAEHPGRARAKWAPLAETKLRELAEREKQLRAMRQLLQATIDCECLNLAECGRRIAKATAAPRR